MSSKVEPSMTPFSRRPSTSCIVLDTSKVSIQGRLSDTYVLDLADVTIDLHGRLSVERHFDGRCARATLR